MLSPTRLLVQEKLTVLLEGFTFEYDRMDDPISIPLTDRVYRGRSIFGSETDAPFISILEAPIPAETNHDSRAGSNSVQDWELVVQGFAPDDRKNPTDPAHFLLAPVKKLLALEKRKADWVQSEDGILGLGNIVDDMYIGAGVVRPADELSRSAYFWLTLTLKMVEDLAEPFAQQ